MKIFADDKTFCRDFALSFTIC